MDARFVIGSGSKRKVVSKDQFNMGKEVVNFMTNNMKPEFKTPVQDEVNCLVAEKLMSHVFGGILGSYARIIC